jgi:hypothetical protein
MSKKPFIVVPDNRPRPFAERVFSGIGYRWRIAWKPWHKDRNKGTVMKRNTR